MVRSAAWLVAAALGVLALTGAGYADDHGPRPNQVPPPDPGYHGVFAASYADTYALHENYPRYDTLSSDCANFVSQALYAGGMPFVNGGSFDATHAWWYRDAYDPLYGALPYQHPNSWTVAEDLRQYLVWDVPGGVYEGTYGPSHMSDTFTPNAVVTGDLLFYRWNGGSTENHVSIQVGIGTDPNTNWYGNLVDQHTTNRRHAFWSLRPYNTQWATTSIDFYHVDPNN